MSPALKDVIRYRLNRAKETLYEAQILLENSLPFATTNRCYYAAFYAVSALLLVKGKSSSKHSGILSLLHSELVKSGLIADEDGKLYTELFKYRMKADYEDFTMLESEEVGAWLNRTVQFVERIETLVSQELA